VHVKLDENSTTQSLIKTPVKNETTFPSSHWKHILTLLGLIIVADRKVLKEEMDTFLDVASELRARIDPAVYLTRHMAKDWFILNKPKLLEIIDNLTYDTAILETLAPIKSMPHKLDVITGMVKIAISDGVYSNVEKSLIKKTILYWNISADLQRGLEVKSPKTIVVSSLI
jgi:uncharacterized tellurite resistance protein B-like protein